LAFGTAALPDASLRTQMTSRPRDPVLGGGAIRRTGLPNALLVGI
jgi:hypothetical protein